MPGPRPTLVLLLLAAVAAGVVFVATRGDTPSTERAHPDEVEPPRDEPRLAGRIDAPQPRAETPSDAADEAGSHASRDGATSTLRVWVHDATDGNPVPGVQVTARFEDGSRREGRTDTDGETTFEQVAPGLVDVWAETGDLQCAFESRSLQAGEEHTVDLRLSRAIRLTGRVLDARTGRGVAGAVVGTDRLRGDWWRGRPGPGAAFTDATGHFEAWALFRRLRWFHEEELAVALAPGYALGLAAIAWPRPDERPIRLTFRLQPGGVVRGLVTRPDGTPAAGADVVLLPQIEDWVPPPTPDDLAGLVDQRRHGATADEHGRFEVQGLPLDGAFSAVATADGFASSRPVRDLCPAAARPSLDTTLALRENAEASVRVLDADGDPVMDAQVELVDLLGISETTDEDGLVEDWVVPPGHHVLRVTAAGEVPFSQGALLPAGELTEVEIHLERGFGIAGVLLDAAGDPEPFRPIEAWALDGGVRGSAWTAEDGRFRIDGLAPVPHRLRCGTSVLQRAGSVVTAPAQGIRVVLPPHGWLRIRFDAAPAVEQPQQVDIRYVEDGVQSHVTASASPTSGAGLIYVCSVPAGRRPFRIEPPKHAPVVLEVDVPAGERPVDVVVPLGPGLALEGRVIDGTDQPVAGAWVSVWDRQGADARTDAEGWFRIPRLASEAVRLHVNAEGHVPVDVERVVAPKTGPTTIVLQRGGILRGRVVDEDGEGADAAIVSIRSAHQLEDATRLFHVTTDELGAFRTRVPPGTWQVGLDRAVGFVVQAEVVVETDGDAEVDLVVPDA